MSGYMLDTCTVSDLFAGMGKTVDRLQVISPAEVSLSAITVMEVLYGFRLHAAARRKFGGLFEELCSATEIIPFDDESASIAAAIRADLKAKGKPLGSLDLLIGATALANQCTLVTSNTREFERITGLKVESWR